MLTEEVSGNLRAIFKVTAEDLTLIAKGQDKTRQIIPGLLKKLNEDFSPWPELKNALTKNEVHEPRLAHWMRVATGDLGPGFIGSANRLATALYTHGVPAQAVAICHGGVIHGIIDALGLNTVDSRSISFGRAGEVEKFHLRNALNKLAWLDLEILLESYNAVGTATRQRTLSNLRDFETKLEMIVGVVGDSVTRMQTSAQSLTRSVDETGRRTATVAEVSVEATRNVETAAVAADKLAASLGSVAGQVTKAASIANTANRTVRDTDSKVQALAGAAQKIGEVVSLINSIAGQTNLLALNATIEAARAGDAGKGFAVVASEVKNLASQTARATEDITQQISAIQAATQETVEAIRGIGEIVASIDQIAVAIAEAVDNQRSATDEIAGNVQRAAQGTQNVASTITGVRDITAASDRAAGDVLTLSGDLGSQTDDLKQAFADLVRRVRAG